ncbi:MAG: putrescine ABC transporter permease PotH [Deltaproteobacteria bacterium]|nr:MAG: putrescine ABC transporter permease PotH [Deltaproteobacteria bacterium]
MVIKRFLPSGRNTVIGIPFFWLLLFLVFPFAIVLKISFAEMVVARPPFTELFVYAQEKLTIILNPGNYLFLLEDHLYIIAYLSSVKTAAVATILALLIGYPMAYGVARANPGIRNLLLLGIVLPSWTSFLLRIYAWIGLLKTNGLINNLLLKLNIIDAPLHLLHTDFAVYIGIVYAYLPFMILPLYTNLVKLDESYLEASADLGARPWKTFLSVTLPLSKGGIIAGSMLVFIPAVGEFVIPALLGGPDTLMIGKILWDEFFSNRDWPVASAVAIVMLLLLIIPMMWFHKHQTQEMENI